MRLVTDLAATLGVKAACEALQVSRATYYRWLNPKARPAKQRARSSRSLCQSEKERIVDLAVSEKYCDVSPRQMYFDLLTHGQYIASARSIYRVLAQENLSADKRSQRTHPEYVAPKLLATAPNQVWTWDITILPGAKRGVSFHLAVLLDMFSRYVVGWMVTARATARTGQTLIGTALDRYRLAENQITIHSDRGPQMRAGSWKDLEMSLGITRSFSRPRVSNDNPYVESHFKTLKYRPGFPGRFGSMTDARGFCQDFFRWYNHEHYHSAIADLTPFSFHFGTHHRVLARRQQALDQAYNRHPERFRLPPTVKLPPTWAGINYHEEPDMHTQNLY